MPFDSGDIEFPAGFALSRPRVDQCLSAFLEPCRDLCVCGGTNSYPVVQPAAERNPPRIGEVPRFGRPCLSSSAKLSAAAFRTHSQPQNRVDGRYQLENVLQ
jgi:hypothetical protein